VHSTPQKSSNYAWEKKQIDNSSAQSSSTPSPTDIAKSLSQKSKKKRKTSGSIFYYLVKKYQNSHLYPYLK
jgi:hypothetical protein